MQEGRLEEVYLELLGEERRLDRRLCTTSAMCARCHSGGLTRPILCQNGECSVRSTDPDHSYEVMLCMHLLGRGDQYYLTWQLRGLQVLYARLGTQTKLENLGSSMNRIEKLNW